MLSFEMKPSVNISLTKANRQRILAKIPTDFTYVDFIKAIKTNFGENSIKSSHFICMNQALVLKDQTKFELQKNIIRNGAIVLWITRTKTNVQQC